MIKRVFAFAFLLCLLLGLDFFSKQYVFNNIPLMGWQNPSFPFGGIGVFQDLFGLNFVICHVHNTGCAWGMFAQFSDLLFFVRVILILALVIYILFLNKEKANAFPLFLIVSGAIGNVFDFFLYGQVVDMFYFYWKNYSFPVFNLADVFISSGIFVLFLNSAFKEKKAFL